MKIEVHRVVAEWHTEVWHVEIPDDTPAGEIEDAAIDAMQDDPLFVCSDAGDLVQTIDAEYTRVQQVSA